MEKNAFDINEVSAAQIAMLSRIGWGKAQEIVNHRNARGFFKSWEGLKEVHGISDDDIERLVEAGAVIDGAGEVARSIIELSHRTYSRGGEGRFSNDDIGE